MPPRDCPFCKQQNPAGAKFCNECGSPLHLVPCESCGAVSGLTDTHCWRCGGPLPRADLEPGPGAPPRPLASPQRRSEVSSEHDAGDLELALEALERRVRGFEADAFEVEPAPGPGDSEPRGGELAPEPGDPLPVGVESGFPESSAPEAVPAGHPPRGRWRESRVAALAAALGLAAVLGVYLHASPDGGARTSPPPELRIAGDVAEPAVVLPPKTAPGARSIDARFDERMAKDVGEGAVAVRAAPTVAPQPGCPPAVAAMDLCGWLLDANRQ